MDVIQEKVLQEDDVEYHIELVLRILENIRTEPSVFPSVENAVAACEGKAKLPFSHNKTNRILFITGCFNPPHLGHLLSLKEIFNKRKEMGIVAAMLFPNSDLKMRSMKKEGSGVIITPQEVRNEIWAQATDDMDGWLWMMQGVRHKADRFLMLLQFCIGRSNYKDVRLVRLLGSDKITIHEDPGSPSIPHYGCTEILVSNYSREVDFFNKENKDPGQIPLTIPGCTNWVKEDISLDEEGVDPENKKACSWWSCQAVNVQDVKMLMVHFLPAGDCPKELLGISSTKIRKIMAETPEEELEERLDGLVLQPKVLLSWLKENRKE